jgi:hypothetical protein
MAELQHPPPADQPALWLCRSKDPAKPGLVRLRAQLGIDAVHRAYALLGVAAIECELHFDQSADELIPRQPEVQAPRRRRSRPALRLVTA